MEKPYAKNVNITDMQLREKGAKNTKLGYGYLVKIAHPIDF